MLFPKPKARMMAEIRFCGILTLMWSLGALQVMVRTLASLHSSEGLGTTTFESLCPCGRNYTPKNIIEDVFFKLQILDNKVSITLRPV